jgi:ankyrin repeat protein
MLLPKTNGFELFGFSSFKSFRWQDQSTPLHLACGSGNFAISSLLLKHGADVNQKNKVPCSVLSNSDKFKREEKPLLI